MPAQGCDFATLGQHISFLEGATLKKLRRVCYYKTSQPLQGCEQFLLAFLNPGFQSKPWADIGERFQRYSRTDASSSL